MRSPTQPALFLPLEILVQPPINFILDLQGDTNISSSHPCHTLQGLEESPSKRRVQDSPICGSGDALDTTALVSQLVPELKDVLQATMRCIVPVVIQKAVASGSLIRAERAVDQANKREREAREIVLK